MNPLKRKELTRELSLDLDIEFEKVDMVVRLYYFEIQKMMSSCEHVNIKIPELGTLNALDYRLNKKIEKLEAIKESVDPLKSLRSYTIVNEINKDLHSLTSLKEKVDSEKQRKKEIKQQRNDSKNN